MATVPYFGLEREYVKSSITGIRKASVLPLPVGDAPRTFLPDNKCGMACDWIGFIFTKSWAASDFLSPLLIGSSSNFVGLREIDIKLIRPKASWKRFEQKRKETLNRQNCSDKQFRGHIKACLESACYVKQNKTTRKS